MDCYAFIKEQLGDDASYAKLHPQHVAALRREWEMALIRYASTRCGHITTRTAKVLGMNRNTLHRKRRELGNNDPFLEMKKQRELERQHECEVQKAHREARLEKRKKQLEEAEQNLTARIVYERKSGVTQRRLSHTIMAAEWVSIKELSLIKNLPVSTLSSRAREEGWATRRVKGVLFIRRSSVGLPMRKNYLAKDTSHAM